MIDIILNIYNDLVNIIQNLGVIFGFFLIILESIFPVLPLAIFIAINITAFGSVLGYLISWIATIVGCVMSFVIFRRYFSERLYKKIKDKEKINDLVKWISNVKFPHLVVLIALPFAPAFLINIAAGLSKIKFKKFLFALFIGKIFIIYFWGYIGYNLIELLSDPKGLVQVVLMLVLAYIISKYIGEKLNID